jgi:hypothetical protein
LLQPRARERTRRGAALSAFVVLLVVVVAPLARASGPPPLVSDSVRVWNAHALAAIFNAPTAPVPGAGQTPPVGTLHMAMTQLAVYDAVNAIHGGYEPYLDGLPSAAPSSSLDAAVATAAHHVLVGLGIDPVPALPQVVRDRLDGLYGDALDDIPDGAAKDGGIAAGAVAAAAMLAERTGDGRYVPSSFPVGTDPGEWRPAPPAFGNDLFAWVAKVEPFTLKSTSQFRTKGPLELASRAYAKEYDEVKKLGSLTNSTRTPEQLALAQFYTANPVEMFNRALRAITEDEGLGIVDEARFYAQVNVSGADALINCWDDKAFWHFWRPITAIQNGDDDTNSRTVGDMSWTPWIATGTPPYPDHPSGYNCATGALMNAAQGFLGKKADLRVENLALGVTREYKRFTDVLDDTIDARIYEGLHFRTPDVQGARLGKDVARWVDKHFFGRAKKAKK